ncbi:MAG: thiamine biosynthesis protein ThiS [candidate division GAL15 bacterium]
MSGNSVSIRLNGRLQEVPEGTTLQDLLGSPRPGVAAAVNGQVVPRERWQQYVLREDDRVEFVQAVQGG